jgi:CheY-like chemotaxis protein
VRARKRIIVIDDDPDFVEYTRIILEAASYDILTANNAAEGLALARRIQPDLVITDVMMSYSLEGTSVTRAIRNDPTMKHIPVLVITAIARTPTEDLFPPGAEPAPEGFLTKPVPPEKLLSAVRRCLSSTSACRLR